MPKTFLTLGVDVTDIAVSLADELTNEELIEFITKLDDSIGDWDFTAALYNYARKEMRRVQWTDPLDFLPPREERCPECKENPGQDCWRCDAEESSWRYA